MARNRLLSRLWDRVLYNVHYAPSDYPAEDHTSFLEEFLAMRDELRRLIEGAEHDLELRWLRLAELDLSRAGELYRATSPDADQALESCADYIRRAINGDELRPAILLGQDSPADRDVD
jgi:hypothetical protein